MSVFLPRADRCSVQLLLTSCPNDVIRDHHNASTGALLPLINPSPPPAGVGDRSVQAYNYRLCFTQNRSNWLPIPLPDPRNEYSRPETWELLRRWVDARAAAGRPVALRDVLAIHPTVHGKNDVNDAGPIGTDLLGGSRRYADGNWSVRAAVVDEHVQYTRGLLAFWKSDRSVPPGLRANVSSWGLCADEWPDTGGWPPQLYVRETRRMVGALVLTQHDRMPQGGQRTKPDSIGLGSYGFDNHNHERIATGAWVYNEGNVNTDLAEYRKHPFELPYRSITPKASDVTNLLVTCCFSASHIAYGAVRLEPQLMMLGEAAGTAAAMTLARPRPVQQLDVAALQVALRANREYPRYPAVLHESQMVYDAASTHC